jgi:zinc transporter ZupT
MLLAQWMVTGPVLDNGRSPGATAWFAVALVSVSTLAGAWLARRDSGRAVVWLAIASATMMVVALTDLLPDAWQDAVQDGVPLWALGIAVATGFGVITYFTRKGCACASDTGTQAARRHAPGRHRRIKEAVSAAMFGGMGTAAALTLHRVIEGATLALTGSVVVVLALMVHSASEGLALAALLDMAKQRLGPWLVVSCVSPAVGVLVAEISPLPDHIIPLLLGTVAGVLLRIAVVGVKLAAAQEQGGLRRRHVVVAVAAAIALGTLITTARATQGQATSRPHAWPAIACGRDEHRPPALITRHRRDSTETENPAQILPGSRDRLT